MPLSDWILDDLCARGASADVWRARHHIDHRPAVIKIARDEGERVHTAFLREERALARLDHVAIPRLADSGRARGRPWLALEDAGPVSLARWCRQPRPWPEVRSVLLQLLDALAHVHRAGLVHLDVKPGNVVLRARPDGTTRATLVDFGLARRRGSDGGPRASGTPSYMAPEQVRASWRHMGPWTDLYGLGGLAWRVLTGRHAVQVPRGRSWTWAQVQCQPGSFTPRRPVPVHVETWLRRLLAKRPAHRFLSVSAAREGLLQPMTNRSAPPAVLAATA